MTKVSVETKVNKSAINAKAEQAFREMAFLLGREFTKAISSNVWEWPFGQSPRDIVDRGELRGSQQLVFLGPFEAEFTWNKDYALYVHEGYTLGDGTVLPPRDWTRLALEGFSVAGTVETLMNG